MCRMCTASRPRVSSGLGLFSAIASGTMSTLSSVKKRLSGGPETLLSPEKKTGGTPTSSTAVERHVTSSGRQSSNVGVGADFAVSSNGSRASTVRSIGYNKHSGSENLSYTKSSRPPPPPPGSINASMLRGSQPGSSNLLRPTASSLAKRRVNQPSEVDAQQRDRLEMLKHSSTSLRSTDSLDVSKATILRAERGRMVPAPLNLSQSMAPSGERNMPQYTIEVSPAGTITPRPGLARMPQMKSSSRPAVRHSPSKSRLVPDKSRSEVDLDPNHSRPSLPPHIANPSPKHRMLKKSGVRSSPIKAKTSNANLAMAAKQQELTARRSRLAEERKLRDLLGA